MSEFCQFPNCGNRSHGFVANDGDLSDRFCAECMPREIYRIKILDPSYFQEVPITPWDSDVDQGLYGCDMPCDTILIVKQKW